MKNTATKEYTIRDIEALTETQAAAMAIESVTVKGHQVYFVDFGGCFGYSALVFRFLYKGIIIKHNKTEPTYTKTSLFLCEKRRFFMARTEKGVVTTI